MITLGIETSCDETAVAIFDSDKGLIGESVFSQIDLHSEYGGVIPELASRDHCKKIIQIYKRALGAINPSEIDYVAYTAGPGLLGALLIGENFAQGLALSLNKPLIPVNHLEAHLMAPFLDEEKVEFPFWNQLNGPIEDAVWHSGQIVAFRRASGNPISKKISVFTGKVRED